MQSQSLHAFEYASESESKSQSKSALQAALILLAVAVVMSAPVAHAANSTTTAGPTSAHILRMSLSDDATTLDPHVADLVVNNRLLHNIYEGLVTRDKDFKLAPALALSWSQTDAKTWRFKLRPNVKFHDGTPFTADDVVFSVGRVLHPLSALRSSLFGARCCSRAAH